MGASRQFNGGYYPPDDGRRIGSAGRDPYTGRRFRKEVNEFGLPMGSTPIPALQGGSMIGQPSARIQGGTMIGTQTPRIEGATMLKPQSGSLPAPFSGLPSLSPDDARAVVDARRMQLGMPTSAEAAQSAATESRVASAAGSGQVVQTPYGTVSSTRATPGADAPAVVSDTGVSRPNWHQQLIALHPEIGVAGTTQNEAFVKAYKASQAGGKEMERNPFQIAQNIYNPAKERPIDAVGRPLESTAATQTPGQDFSAPLSPVMFAGFDVGGMRTNRPENAPQTVAGKTGEVAGGVVRGAYEGMQQMPGSPRSLFNEAGRLAKGAYEGVSDFAHSLFDGNYRAPDRTEYKPTFANKDMSTMSAKPDGSAGPVNLPNFAWSKPAEPNPSRIALQGYRPGDAGSLAPEPMAPGSTPPPKVPMFAGVGSAVQDFSKNEAEADWQKKLRASYINDGR